MINLSDLPAADLVQVRSVSRSFDRPRAEDALVSHDDRGRLVVTGAMHGQAESFTRLDCGTWVETDSPAARED